MKFFALIILALALSGCMNQTMPDGAKPLSIIDSITALKSKPCNQLSTVERAVIVFAIKSQVPNYPEGGICDPLWLDKELTRQLDNQG